MVNTRVVMVFALCLGLASLARGGLVSYWAFNDGSGSFTAADSQGSNNGSLQNMNASTAWVAGHTGGTGDYALDFEADSSNYVNVGNDSSLDIHGSDAQITISLWAKLESSPRTGCNFGILSKGEWKNGYSMLSVAGNVVSGNIDAEVCETASGLALDTWYHLAMTYDDSTVRVYIDGEEKGSRSESDGIASSTYPVNIGREQALGGRWYFDGLIDDVAIWNEALSASDVSSLAGGTSPLALGLVPEPGAFTLTMLGVLGILAFARPRRRNV